MLPSQGGAGAGFDLSASTQIIPVIDLTESAEGSNVRADLQTALSFNNITAFSVAGSTSTIINTTGYFRVFGFVTGSGGTGGVRKGDFSLTDGASTKVVTEIGNVALAVSGTYAESFDFVVFLSAGDSLTCTTNDSGCAFTGSTRQIADINGNLITPT